MRNISKYIGLFMILASWAIGLVSCSDEAKNVDDMNSVKVTFTAVIPEETRAYGDASQVNMLVVAAYTKEDDNYIEVERKNVEITNAATAVQFTLVKNQPFTFVFWAYNSECDIYDTEDLTAINMTNCGAVTFEQSEKCDAFFAAREVTNSYDTEFIVELVRPLAQINVGTTGDAVKAGLTVNNAPTTFYPLSNSVGGSANYTWEFTNSTTEKLDVDGVEYNYLAVAYLFASETPQTYSAGITIANDDETTTTLELESITLQSNSRCNIVGNITAN